MEGIYWLFCFSLLYYPWEHFHKMHSYVYDTKYLTIVALEKYYDERVLI